MTFSKFMLVSHIGDLMKIRDFTVVSCDAFLANHDLGNQLSAGKTKEYTEFRLHCRQFVDRLIVILLENTYARSVFAKGMCSFCPELMLQAMMKQFLSCLRSDVELSWLVVL